VGGGPLNDVQRTLIRFELLQLARDRRTLAVAVLAPLVLLPALLLVNRITDSADEERRAAVVYRWAAAGPEAERVEDLMVRALALPDSVVGNGGVPLERVDTPVPDSLLAAGELHLVAEGVGPDSLGLPLIRLRYRASWDLSSTAVSQVSQRLEAVRTVMRDSLFRAAGLPVDPAHVLAVEEVNVATAVREGGSFLGVILPPLLVLLMLTGGSIVAADTLSGEKERGTLETLLTTSASRKEIIGAKGLAILAVGLVITLINLANLAVYLGLGLVELPSSVTVSVTPYALAALAFLLLPVAFLVAVALLLVSGLSRSYREYQLLFFPAFLVLLVPSAAGFLPGLELRSAVILVPVANVALAVRDVLAGRPDLALVVLSAVITGGAAAGLGKLAERTLSTERLLGDSAADRAEVLGGTSLFPYRVLRWFGLLWVTLVGLSVWFGDALGIRGQILVNVVGLFLGGALVMVWRYRLPVREALALRPVPALVWPAVLVGAPSALLVGMGLANVTGRFLPMPSRMMEAFGQFLLPDDMGLVQLVFLLAVVPGICEEVAFRGVLLYGLRRRLGPVALCLAVGVIFGLFHVSLYRIVPTAYLGVILAVVVVLTGSILPAMLWHALNNAVVLVPAHLGWMDTTRPVPGWAYAAAGAGLLLSLAVLARVGDGYPGVTRPEGLPPPG
jgi:sodium transport system permease protein